MSIPWQTGIRSPTSCWLLSCVRCVMDKWKMNHTGERKKIFCLLNALREVNNCFLLLPKT